MSEGTNLWVMPDWLPKLKEWLPSGSIRCGMCSVPLIDCPCIRE